MSLMTKKQAYQNLLIKASSENSRFKVKGKDRKGRCTTNSGRSDIHHREQRNLLEEITNFKNVVNGLGESNQKIDITIPEFITRPKPITQDKKLISSKYNKTCKCQIKKYANPCTYWLSWHNDYFITKSSQLKQYKKMIDNKFNIDELLLTQQEENRITEEKRISEELLTQQQEETSFFEVETIDTIDVKDSIEKLHTVVTKDTKIPLGLGGLAIAGIIAYLVFKK
jgi:hypothetical protein